MLSLCVLTRQEFLEAAQRAGIGAVAFDLNGDGDEKYVLRSASGGWEVYYSERGLERNLRTFGVEEHALQHLLTLLASDHSTRVSR